METSKVSSKRNIEVQRKLLEKYENRKKYW